MDTSYTLTFKPYGERFDHIGRVVQNAGWILRYQSAQRTTSAWYQTKRGARIALANMLRADGSRVTSKKGS